MRKNSKIQDKIRKKRECRRRRISEKVERTQEEKRKQGREAMI